MKFLEKDSVISFSTSSSCDDTMLVNVSDGMGRYGDGLSYHVSGDKGRQALNQSAKLQQAYQANNYILEGRVIIQAEFIFDQAIRNVARHLTVG